jgi:peptide deformylase
MFKRKLIYYDNPILRQKAKLVEKITDETRQLVDEMFWNLRQHRGIGLAAPQLAESLRVFITLLENEEETGLPSRPLVFINPQLSAPSEEVEVMEEGCLSLPGLRVPIERPLSITVAATDIEGNPFTHHLTGLGARLVMHETDHLNGVLSIDRVRGKARNLIKPRLLEIKRLYENS